MHAFGCMQLTSWTRVQELRGGWPAPDGPDAGQHVAQVLANLVGGLQAEQAEVAQQVVVRREELQVQLGQRQARLACPACMRMHQAMLRLSAHSSRRLHCPTCLLGIKSRPSSMRCRIRQQCVRTCVVHLRHLVLVPQDALGGVQRHGVHDLRLRLLPLVAADRHLRQERRVARPGVVLRDQPR